MDIGHPQDRETESFAGLLLRHRGRTGLTQRDVAARMGTSERSVQDWEAGVYYPGAQKLKSLISVLLEAGGLTVGREVVEGKDLWAAVLREAPRMHTPFDELWLAELRAMRVGPQEPNLATEPIATVPAVTSAEAGAVVRRQDWGEAPDVLGFVGRTEELATLRELVLEQGCRLLAVRGGGGIGKTTLAARLAQDVAPTFQSVYWRSLRDAPPTSEWLGGAIGFLSDQRAVLPEGEAAPLTALLQLLRSRRSLLVLDNFEALLEPGQREGRYRDGYAGYGRLLQAIGEARHQSCLVVTSREAPADLDLLGGGAVRTLELGGLGVPEGQVLLADKQLSGTTEDWTALITRSGGNGLALKVVGESIREVFGGDIAAFLDGPASVTFYGGIRRLLDEQIERSSPLEKTMLRVLAVEREPVSLGELIVELGPSVGRGAILEAVEALRRRSLVERAETANAATFTLQSVLLEYVTDRLVETVADEIGRGQPNVLVEQPLIKAQGKDYVRQTQERLIGAPILQRLNAQHSEAATEPRLLALLDGWRGRPAVEQGHGPGNVINLLRLLRGNLRGLNLSHLAILHAYLAEVDAQDARLVDAHLVDTVLPEAFDFPGSVALSGDGGLLAVGTATGQVWLWRVADRTPLQAVHGHTGAVWGIALSADGQLVATVGGDGTVQLLEASTGRLLWSVHGHTGAVWGVSLSADGLLVASGSADGTLRLWETSSGRLLAILEGHSGGVYGVALSADGLLVASGSADGTLRLWETSSGRLLAILEGHTSAVWRVALSADGRLAASSGADGTVRMWETSTGRPVATMDHTSAVWGMALSADGQLVASGGEDGTVRLWEVSTGRPRATLLAHRSVVRGVALSADGRLLATAAFEGAVRLWQASTGRQLATLQGHTGEAWGVALSADGHLLASGGGDGTVRLWEASTGRQVAALQGHTGGVWGLALTADGHLVASGAGDGTVRLWQASTGRPLATLQAHTGLARGVALSADGRLLASGGADGTVRLWEASTGRALATLQDHTGAVWDLELSSDGRLLVSSGEDRTVRLWETSSGRLVATLQGHTSAVWGVALSADGQLLASGGFEGTVRLWEGSTGRLLSTLQGHTGAVWGVAVSADCQLVASGGEDGTVRLWEARSGTASGHPTGPHWRSPWRGAVCRRSTVGQRRLRWAGPAVGDQQRHLSAHPAERTQLRAHEHHGPDRRNRGAACRAPGTRGTRRGDGTTRRGLASRSHGLAATTAAA